MSPFNIMFGLGKQAPVEYTNKTYEQLTTETFNIVDVKVSTDSLTVNTKTNKTTLKTNTSTIKTDSKTTLKLNLRPDE